MSDDLRGPTEGPTDAPAEAVAEAVASGEAAPEERSSEIHQALSATDLEMVRVLEDLIAVLIDTGVIKLTDLPKPAQDKLDRRLRLRARLADRSGFVAEADDIVLP